MRTAKHLAQASCTELTLLDQYEQIDLECKKLACNLFSSKHSWRSTAAYLKREVVRNHTRSRYDDYAMRMVGDSLWSRAWDTFFEMGLDFWNWIKVKPCLSPNTLSHANFNCKNCNSFVHSGFVLDISKTDETFTIKVSM